MKVGVISDTHGDAHSWGIAWEHYLRDCDAILHAGDVLYHGPRNPVGSGLDPADLAVRLNSCPVPLIIARGNCDAEVDASVLWPPLFSPGALFRYGEANCFVHHGDRLGEERLQDLVSRYRLRLVVAGHTHVATLREEDGVIYLNPGSLSLPKDARHTRSLALLEDNFIKVIALETGHVLLAGRI